MLQLDHTALLTSEQISLTHLICGDPVEGRSALDRRELAGTKGDRIAISLGGGIRSGLPGRPRVHGQSANSKGASVAQLALDRRELVGIKSDSKSISLNASVRSGLPDHQRDYGEGCTATTLRDEIVLNESSGKNTERDCVNMNDSHEVSKAAPMLGRVALVIGMDEFFRLALVEMLKTRFDYTTIVEMNAFDRTHENSIEAEAVHLTILEYDWGLDCSDRVASMRQRYPYARVVVVALSARPDDILDALRAGAHGLVPKGISVTELIEALNVVLSGAFYIPSLAEDASQPRRVSSPAFKRDSPELTRRQVEVLRHIVQGRSNKQIARLMSLREGTIKIHVAGLFRNLGVSNRSQAAVVGSLTHSGQLDAPGASV